MSIISIYYPIFLTFFIFLYFLCPKKIRPYTILLASMCFYLLSGIKAFVVTLITTLFTFVIGIFLQKLTDKNSSDLENIEDTDLKKQINSKYKKTKNLITTFSIFVIIGLWLLLKLGSRYNDEIFFIPLGISFYSLNAISYLIDLNRNRYHCETNFLKLLTYILYFPHIIQGPFSRYDKLSEQLFTPHDFSYDRFYDGATRILFGYFKKLVVADKLSIIVSTGLANVHELSGLSTLICILLYGFELYADFSGYMDIICGVSRIYGITSNENFKQPYFSKSIDEFWRRWHISLGAWFKDYLFYPISMNKTVQKISRYVRNKVSKKMGKLTAAYIALFFVWTATGLWHNFTINYLIWGYLNMLCIVLSMQLEDFNNNLKTKLNLENNIFFTMFRIIRTYILVSFIRIFSITNTPIEALQIIKQIFVFSGSDLSIVLPEIRVSEIIISLIGVVIIIVVDILNENDRWQSLKAKCPIPLRNIVYALMIVSLILFAGSSSHLLKGFIYAKF